MKLLVNIFSCITLLIASPLYAQKRFIKEFLAYEQTSKEGFRNSLLDYSDSSSFLPPDSFHVFSMYRITAVPKKEVTSKNIYKYLSLDTTFSLVFFIADDTFQIGNKEPMGKEIYYSISATTYSPENVKQNKILSLAIKAKRFSKFSFFISFLPQENPYYNPALGFFDNDGLLKIVDTAGNKFTLTQYLCRRYASTEKYVERFNQSIERNKLYDQLFGRPDSVTALKNSIALLSEDYQTITEYFPNDSVRILETLLSEIQKSLQPKECQIATIRKGIVAQLQNKRNLWKGAGFYFNGYDIESLLKTTLTRSEFDDFIERHNNLQFLRVRALNYLFLAYSFDLQKKGVKPDDNISERANEAIKNALMNFAK